MYTPNNVCVYLKAFAGAMAGLRGSGNFILDTAQANYTVYARMADAYAQQVDTIWGVSIPTGFEEDTIEETSESIWQTHSRLENGVAFSPSNYTGLATSLVALVRAANAQVVAEGVDPNGCNQGTGSQGAQGSQGVIGSQGAQGGVGGAGPQGNQGLKGSQGGQGLQGTQGAGLQGAQGGVGAQGGSGAQGSQGSQGAQGPGVGSQGAQGFQGSQGNQGFQGNQGSQGTAGTGNQGAQGAQGAGGGAQGSQGAQGPAGSGLAANIGGTSTGVALSDITATTTPIIVGAVDITSARSGIFIIGCTFDGQADTSVETIAVTEWTVNVSVGITAGYTGGSSSSTIGNARYLSGSSIAGGTGGSAKQFVTDFYNESIQATFSGMGSGCFVVPLQALGVRLGFTFQVISPTVGGVSMSGISANFYVFELGDAQ